MLRHSWPYARDGLSGLKNGRHAVVNASFILHGAYAIANPIGISVGAVLALVLMVYRHMDRKRDRYIKHNKALLAAINSEKDNAASLSHHDIKRQSQGVTIAMYLAAGFNGVTDGMYLFVFPIFIFCIAGAASALTAGAPLIIAIVLISLHTIISTYSRVKEEKQKQRMLNNSIKACEKALQADACAVQPEAEKISANTPPTNLNPASTNIGFFTALKKNKWTAYRGFLSGAKNIKAIFDRVKRIIALTVIAIPLLAIAALGYFIYGSYLLIQNVTSAFNKQSARVSPSM